MICDAEIWYPEEDHSVEYIDYTNCDYYKRCQGVKGYESGTCSFGCWEEPACIT